MKILIIESCEKVIKQEKIGSIVHVRNSIIIQSILQCDLISHESEIKKVIHNKYDAIICMYGSPYMKYDKYLEILDNNKNAKMYWLVNDHDLEDNILLRKFLIKYSIGYNMICNNSREGYRHWILGKAMHEKKLNDWIYDWHTIDLNVLIFKEQIKSNSLIREEKQGCIYYGTFRKHRIKDLLRYNFLNYFISTSTKNMKKFKDAGINANYIEKIDWDTEGLSNFKYSLYVEDGHTHTNYAYMANRFYECLMYDVLLFFDSRCSLVIEKSGYVIDKFLIVSDGIDMQNKINMLEEDNDYYLRLIEKQNSNKKLVIDNQKKVSQEIINIFK